MKYLVLMMLCGALPISAVFAAQNESAVYVCTDENGAREYRNTGAIKGCKKLDVAELNTAPSPGRGTEAKPAAVPAKATAASGLPRLKVGSDVQKNRDSERKLILQDELKSEEGKLASLKTEFGSGEPERRGDERNYAKYLERVATMKDDIARTERNVQALKRELSNIR